MPSYDGHQESLAKSDDHMPVFWEALTNQLFYLCLFIHEGLGEQ